MIRIFLLGTFLVLGGALLLPSRSVTEEDTPAKQDQLAVAAKFRKNCQHCHRPPDLRFASDRAWLDQLKRTA